MIILNTISSEAPQNPFKSLILLPSPFGEGSGVRLFGRLRLEMKFKIKTYNFFKF